MRSTSRRMLRLYLFCPLTQLNFPLKVTTLGGLCGDTAAASFYCSPARRHCSVITCLRPLFAQICPHFQLWKTPWKHISCITKQNSEDVVSTHSQMFLAEQPRSKICKLHSNLSINVFHLKVKQLSLHLEFVQQAHLHYWFFSECALIYTTRQSYEDLTASFFSCHTFHAVITSSWELSGVFLFCSHLNFVIFVQAVHHRAGGETGELTVEIRIRDIAQSPRQSHSHLTLPTLALAERA